MCEIFPEIQNCCKCCSLRMGCIYIAIIGIMTGATGLSGLCQHAKWDFSHVNRSDVTGVLKRAPHKWVSEFIQRSDIIVPLGVATMSVVFMLMSAILFYAALFDFEDVVQLVVWGLFLNIILGFLCVFGVSLQCFGGAKCLFGDMDWLSQSTAICFATGYLILWLYFITVANSYVVTAYD